jgi:hypothetical protein
MLNEGGLHGMQFIAAAETFNRRDLTIADIESERHTGVHRRSIEQDRTGRTGTAIANDFSSCQIKIDAQGLSQGRTRLDLEAACGTIHLKRDRNRTRTQRTGRSFVGLSEQSGVEDRGPSRSEPGTLDERSAAKARVLRGRFLRRHGGELLGVVQKTILLLDKDLMECPSDAKKCEWDRTQLADDDRDAEILLKTALSRLIHLKKGHDSSRGLVSSLSL